MLSQLEGFQGIVQKAICIATRRPWHNGARDCRSWNRLVVAFAATKIPRERFGDIFRRSGRLAHQKRRKSPFAEIGRDGILTGDPLDSAGGRVNQTVAGRFAALSLYTRIPI